MICPKDRPNDGLCSGSEEVDIDRLFHQVTRGSLSLRIKLNTLAQRKIFQSSVIFAQSIEHSQH